MFSSKESSTPPTEYPALMDTLYRFGAGVDRGDAALLASAFHASAVVDFTPCGRKLGLDFPVLKGAESIVGFLASTHQTQGTSHVITNGRADQHEGTASLQVLVDATHLLLADPRRRFRMMNWYTITLERVDAAWLIRDLKIDNIWSEGHPEVLFGK